MSIWGLFLAADPLVKAVMLLLVLASIWCWAIIVDKVGAVRRERRQADEFEDAFWSGGSADALYDEIGTEPRDAMTMKLQQTITNFENGHILARLLVDIGCVAPNLDGGKRPRRMPSVLADRLRQALSD